MNESTRLGSTDLRVTKLGYGAARIDAIPADDQWLRTSPELHMKRLIQAGHPRVFQIGPCFRAGEYGTRHRPEFTMLEWYCANVDYRDILQETQELLQAVAAGTEKGKLAVVGWGSTFGAIEQAVKTCREDGLDVSHIHIRYIWPMPRNRGDLLQEFEKILVPEMNNGQLVNLLRAEYLVPAEPLTQISGQPFKVADLDHEIRARLKD